MEVDGRKLPQINKKKERNLEKKFDTIQIKNSLVFLVRD